MAEDYGYIYRYQFGHDPSPSREEWIEYLFRAFPGQLRAQRLV